MGWRLALRDRSLAVVPFVLALAACEPPPEPPAAPVKSPSRPPVPEAPEPRTGMVEFGALFQPLVVNRSVVPAGRIPEGLMTRVLLGPNLVFEASRSSLKEPPTRGPESPPPTAPLQADALGDPVDIELSSLLMRYLVNHASTLIAPAVVRRYMDWRCVKDVCSDTGMTWVERLLWQHQQRALDPQAARGEPLPTVALAVRKLGTSPRTVDAVVRVENNVLTYRPRSSPTEESMCPEVKLAVPVVAFTAEVLDPRDGRIVARIDDERAIVPPKTSFNIHLTRIVPLHSPPYWKQEVITCESAQERFSALARDLLGATGEALKTPVVSMFEAGLRPLITGTGHTPSSTEPSPAGPTGPGKPRGSGPEPTGTNRLGL